MQSDQTVSLRPGGGKGRPFGPRSSASIPGGSSTSSFNSSSDHLFPSRLNDGLGSNSRYQKPSSERIRYKREELYKYKEVLKEIPQDIRTAIDVIEAELAVPEEPEWGRAVSTVGQAVPSGARYAETDTRDWKSRAPLPSPTPEDKGRDGPKEAGKRSDSDWREKDQDFEGSSYQTARQQEPSYSYRQQEPSYTKQPEPPATGPAPAIVRAANPWSARRGEMTEKEKILRTVKGILNKLTPEKFDVLLDQFLNSGIESADILKGVISLLFDKAVLEPTFCPMYAKLCSHLSTALPEFPSDDEDGKPVTFRRVLLNSCQEEFEGADNMRAEIHQLTGPDQEVDRLEKERLLKLRTLGNIRLIGELYKLKMIPERIVNYCIQMLLGPNPKVTPAEENLEALCQLFSTVGKQLDENSRFAPTLDTYFSQMESISKNSRLPARIRFMIQNTIDMRANKWIPRREEVKAKTINEIHAEAEQTLGLRPGLAGLRNGRGAPGSMTMPGLAGNIPIARLGGVMPGMPSLLQGNAKLPGAAPVPNFLSGVDSDGWETIPPSRSKNKIPREGLIPPPNMPPSKPLAAFTGSRPTSTSSKFLPQGSGGSLFGKPSALLGDSGPRTPPVPDQSLMKSLEKERPTLPVKQPLPPPVKQVAPLPSGTKALERKADSLIKEFLSVVDFHEAQLCVEELSDKNFYPQFVQMCINALFTAKDRERDQLGKLLIYLWSKKVLSTQDISSGIAMVVDELEDLAVDVPYAPKYVGSLLGKLIDSEVTGIDVLQSLLEKTENPRQKVVIYEASKTSIQEGSNAEKVLTELRVCEKLAGVI
ncbi:hypothetical protein KP509_09G008000 [Ceratopteris richardii]|uniref:MI domain-containing protein n=1 Tax=Ceratopteris richardii TaxID=49495 RepID=A0A8T2TYQ8_CERRI|nr:hypothetical protein KP509_09G008000 [Ceratopteris richardii]